MVIGVRGTVASAATAVVVGLGAYAAPNALAAPATAPVEAGSPVVTGWAPAGRAGIHPGVVTETAGGGTCTANFVFTQDDRVFLGQAAHCAGTGAATETDGCSSATGPLGTEVTIHGSDGRDRTGGMVYSSWVAMQADGETDRAVCAHNDFALVELSSGDTTDVNPSVPFFGGPTGLHKGPVRVKSRVFGYGNSTTRLGVEALRPKVGTVVSSAPGGFSHEVYAVSPGIPGDSGAGYLTADGEAVGLLSTLNLAPLPVSNGMTDLRRALRYAARHGFADLELEPGTEPFTPNPAALLPGAQVYTAGSSVPMNGRSR
jgi:hypothetical protein